MKKNYSLASMALFIFCAANSLVAGEIYKWLDAEGIKQFSQRPPPKSCITPSCIKLNKKRIQKLYQKKQVKLGQIQAQKIREEEALEKKRQQQKDIIKLTPLAELSPETDLQKSFLAIDSILCLSFNNIREYKNVTQARKYLLRDNHCNKISEKIEYTIIEKQDDFTHIRIYLNDETSQAKWVESKILSE